MTRLVPIALTLLALLVAVAPASAPRLTIREAKIRAFARLLRETERPPDATDATHAAVTIGSCRRSGRAVICHGSLSPVAFSGIDGSTCRYLITVWTHTTRLSPVGSCDEPALPQVPAAVDGHLAP